MLANTKMTPEITEAHREQLYSYCDRTISEVSKFYKETVVPHVGEYDKFLELANRQYPSGMQSLSDIEAELNHYNHTPEAYKSLCDRYIRGYKTIMEKVTKAIQSNTNGVKK